MADNPVTILESFNAQLVWCVRTLRRMVGDEANRQRPVTQRGDNRWSAVLVTDLDAVEDPMGVPATGTAVLLYRKSDGTLERRRKADGTQHTVEVEWRLSFSLQSGTYVHLKRLDGAWTPELANCTSSESSESWA